MSDRQAALDMALTRKPSSFQHKGRKRRILKNVAKMLPQCHRKL
ncbi:hypothetical protein [Bacillus velezensis]